MKKLGLTVFSVICAICIACGIMLMTNVNKASADTVDGDIPVLSATKYKISTDNGGLLIATGIKNYNDVYKVGYIGLDGTTGNKSDTKYYTSIKSGANEWTAQDLFGDDFEDAGMIVWEINYDPAESYEYTAFAEYGRRVDGNLVKYDPVRSVSATSKITPIVINNKSDLDAFGDALLADETAEKHYVLGADIDYGGAKWDAGWYLSGTEFKGTLDGRGYKISNYMSHHGLFQEMADTSMVKNIYLEADLKGSADGGAICGSNSGSIENCMVELNVLSGDTAKFSGIVSGNNTDFGTIANCIVKVASYNGDGTRFPAIAAYYNEGNQGDIINCYAISSYSDYLYGSVTAGLYADDNAFFTSVTTLSAVDGWNGYWSIANGKLYFGDNLVTENVIDKTATAVFDFDRASGSDYTLAVTGIDAGLTVEDITAVKTVSDGTMLSFTKSGDNLVFANAVLSGYIGEQQVYLVTSAAKYKVTICMASDILTTKDEFVAYFNANANKTTSADTYVVLKTDVDMASAKWNYGWPITPASQFQGTFDGRGHIVSNFNTRRGIFWNILSGGTVKNLYVNSPIVGSGAGGGLCYDNAGTIENCAIVTRITAGEKSVPFAGLTVTNSGTVRNCFVKIESYTWYDTAKEFNAVVGSNTGTVSNCYAVASSEYVTAIYGTVTAGLYVSDAAFFESVTTLPAGWNAYWSLSGGTLSFGGNTVIANT